LQLVFVLRRHRVTKLFQFANTCSLETFDADCHRVFEAGTAELEGMLWQDIEARTASPVQRTNP